VPLEAVVSFAGVTKVFLIQDKAARSRQVTVGRIRDGLQEIIEGVKAGETVVVNGQSRLSDGAPVIVQSVEPRGTGAVEETASAQAGPTGR
jgi:multidrug efflux pump subunit AcrA (membrane-fusion protein)